MNPVAEIREPTAADLLAAVLVDRGLVLPELSSEARADVERQACTGVADEATWALAMDLLLRAMDRAVRATGRSVAPRCSTCDQPIRWVTTVKGKQMSIDPLPHPMGNVVFAAGTSRRVVDVVAKTSLPVAGIAYRPHFATCPQADVHRRPKQLPPPRCTTCGTAMDRVMWAAGERTHPCC